MTANNESVLLHLLPTEVLRELQARARRMQHEERFRRYVLSRFWLVLGLLILVFSAGLGGAWLTLIAMVLLLAVADAQWLPHFVAHLLMLVPAFACFLVIEVVLLNRLFAWLEARMDPSVSGTFCATPSNGERH